MGRLARSERETGTLFRYETSSHCRRAYALPLPPTYDADDINEFGLNYPYPTIYPNSQFTIPLYR